MRNIIKLAVLTVWGGALFSQTGPEKKIDSLYRIEVNGVDHLVFIKRENIKNPILFVLHGGPGFSDFYLWQTYNQELEDHFTVVAYDQRGTGLTFTENTPAESMTYQQLTDDAHKLLSFLKKELEQDKAYLLGFSAGTIIGVYLAHRYPQEIEAFISVGQVVNGRKNEKLCLDYNLQKAKEQQNWAALEELKPLLNFYPSGDPKTDLSALKTLRKWNRKNYGHFCEGTSMGQLFEGISDKAKEHIDQGFISKGESFSMEHLWGEIIDLDLLSTHTVFQVPVYFLVGKCDFNTPFSLTQEYFEKIKAPNKDILYFENSGHYVPFVEPEKFNDYLATEILNK
ncbi:alpha/beta fold hydrolase [Ulvibacterium sp.]|uniref:alpha/beta fold hydrolase n=1 Tax=Ulvibacterium sp. TaxID=2665914 RepID=UPI003BAD64E2